MSDFIYVDRFRQLRLRAFEQIGSLSFAHKVTLAVSFAVLTALAAQVKFYVPFTPVPFTLQVFPVLLAGAFLGKYYGGASQLMYLSMGLAGLPVYASWRGGYAVLLGPTGGYIIGFVFAAIIVGHLIHSKRNARSTPRILLAMSAGVGVIYLFGAGYLAILFGLGVRNAFIMGVLPFIGVDLVKLAAASGMARVALPGRN